MRAGTAVLGGRSVEKIAAEITAKAFHGSPYMPEWDTAFSPQQIENVMAYVNSLEQPSEWRVCGNKAVRSP